MTALLLVLACVLLWPRAAAAPVGTSSGSPVAGLRPGVGWRARGTSIGRVGRRREPPPGAVADALEVMAAALGAGLPPAEALALIARQPGVHPGLRPLLGDALEAAAQGQPLAPIWRRHAETGAAGRGGSLDLAAGAWAVSEESGASLAPALDAAARVLRDAEGAAARVSAAAAGSRATMVLLTALPLAGPFAGLAFGVPPSELYLGSPITVLALAIGLVLEAAGWWSCRILLRRATRPAVVPA